MSISELVGLCIYSLVAMITAYGYGTLAISFGAKLLRIKKFQNELNVGVKILIGLGVFGNLSLILGLAGLFQKSYLSLLLMPALLAVTNLAWVSRRFWRKSLSKAFTFIKKDLVSVMIIVMTAGIMGMLFLSAMRPPHATDELHYHFPQAREVASSGLIKHSWDGHYFYGNIPKLIDVMFAVGLEMQGYQLAHVLNYLFLVGFVILVYETLTRRYGIRAASFAAFLLVLFSDYTWNATVGFVDSATSSLEIAALIFTGLWLIYNKQYYLMTSGMLLGLALGSKYSPLPTTLFLTIVILHTSWKKKEMISNLLTFGVPALVMGGYWYIKNWILFGNPFYPMYFGHKGVSEESYQGLMEAIWQWEPKTLPVFLEKLKRWLTYTDATTYISIWAAPIIIIWHRTDTLIKMLLTFYLLYIPYWFFLATHQTRFLLSALLISNILLGIILSKLHIKIILLGTVILFVIGLIARPYPERNLLEHYLWIKMHVVERQFALGNLSEKEFLEREFGCYYSVIDYITQNNLKGNVIDNWSQYKAPSVRYFSTNRFVSTRDLEELRSGDFHFYYYDDSVMNSHLSDQDQYFVKLNGKYLRIHNYVLDNWELIYAIDDCQLFSKTKQNVNSLRKDN